MLEHTVAAGTCFHSATRTLVRSGTDVGRFGRLKLGSECCNRWQTIVMCFRTLQSLSVSFTTSLLKSVVAPRCFHFTMTAVTVDRGSSSRAEMWRTDLLERWHPMTVPRWKSLSSSARPFYCQCLFMEISWRCAQFYTPVSNGCGWNSRIH